jgi:TonB family protein
MREMQLMREQVVDRQVVEITGSRQAYVAALVEIASARVHPAIAMAPLFLGKRQITRRAQMLAQEVSMSRVRLAVSLAMMGTILAGTGQLSAWSFPLQSVRPAPAETQYAAEEAKAFADVWNRAERLQVPRDEATVPSRIPMILAAASAQASPSASPQQSTRPSTAEGQDLAEKAQAFAEAWELARQLPNQRRPPRTLHWVIPEYTEEASRLSGTMTLRFEVGIDGQPRNIRVVRNLETSFFEKAVEALQQWRFQPAEKDGKPVAAEAVAMVHFRPARLVMGVYFPMQ